MGYADPVWSGYISNTLPIQVFPWISILFCIGHLQMLRDLPGRVHPAAQSRLDILETRFHDGSPVSPITTIEPNIALRPSPRRPVSSCLRPPCPKPPSPLRHGNMAQYNPTRSDSNKLSPLQACLIFYHEILNLRIPIGHPLESKRYSLGRSRSFWVWFLVY